MVADEDAWQDGDEEDKRGHGSVGNLSERELEVLALIVDGKTNSEIAWLLRITQHTAKAHVASIIRKLGVASRTEAAVMWVREQYRVTSDE